MNYLAHALLAGPNDALRLGGMLGDFVHGRLDSLAYPTPVIKGVALHRAIDSFTDRHAEVAAARARLPPPYRRYAGILLDIWFDHCLARDFGRWSAQPLEDFSNDLHGLLHRCDELLPPGLRQFRQYMTRHNLPVAYADVDAIGATLAGVSRRLRHINPVASALPRLRERDAPLQAHFNTFFPQLMSFAAAWISQSHAGAPGMSPTFRETGTRCA